jgi:hypothetical protein
LHQSSPTTPLDLPQDLSAFPIDDHGEKPALAPDVDPVNTNYLTSLSEMRAYRLPCLFFEDSLHTNPPKPQSAATSATVIQLLNYRPLL